LEVTRLVAIGAGGTTIPRRVTTNPCQPRLLPETWLVPCAKAGSVKTWLISLPVPLPLIAAFNRIVADLPIVILTFKDRHLMNCFLWKNYLLSETFCQIKNE
jgi:hypothetical protein